MEDLVNKNRKFEEGLLYNITGNGKGKSSSAFGMVARALGYNWRVAIIQFMKSDKRLTGERDFFSRFPEQVTIESYGLGLNLRVGDHQGFAKLAWERTLELLKNFDGELLVLDEINIALHYKYIDIQEVVTALKERKKSLNVIVTGRYSKEEMNEICDLVSEVQNIKHPFEQGISAREGLDF